MDLRWLQGILLDRDGVINRERADYVKSWAEFEFLPGALAALQTLATLDAPILVLTNQSAIGRGLVSRTTVDHVHARAREQISAAGGRIDAFFVCPHHPDEGCTCRKPKPGLLQQAAAAYQLDLRRCVFVGDNISDFEAAKAVNCGSILVTSGRKGASLRAQLASRTGVDIVPDLSAAVRLLLTG